MMPFACAEHAASEQPGPALAQATNQPHSGRHICWPRNSRRYFLRDSVTIVHRGLFGWKLEGKEDKMFRASIGAYQRHHRESSDDAHRR